MEECERKLCIRRKRTSSERSTPWLACCRMPNYPKIIPHFTGILLTLLVLLYPPCVRSDEDYADYPPSQFYQQPFSGSPKAIGSIKLLQCYANGDPSPYYRWIKDGEFLTGNISDTTLRLENLQRSNAGDYQCLSINSHGALLSDKVHIYVAYMEPFAFTGNQDRVVDQGQARIMDLPSLDSYPPPTISWDVWADGNWERIPAEGQRYHMTLTKQLVILETKLSTDNNKMFRARALLTQTGEESDSQTFVLKVQNVGSSTKDIPPEIVVPPSDTYTVQGDDALVLECVANARPLNYLSLKWYRENMEGQRTLIQPDNAKYLLPMYRRRLTILNPITDDSGTYLCEASFRRPGAPDLPTALARATLTVYVKPSFVTPPPSDIEQDVSTTVIIPCVVDGLPKPSVRWFKNGVLIDGQNQKQSLLSNGNLQIVSADTSDSGIFQCFAKNEAGEINRATWVRVLSFAPEITEPPSNLTIIEGDLAHFPCTVTGAPLPTILWYRVTADGVEELPGNNERIQLIDNEVLITKSIVDDTGKYVCNATNSLGSAAAEAWLRVMVRTRIVQPPRDAEVIKASRTVLQCGVIHDPNVTVHWRWYHKNVLIDPENDPRRQIHEEGSLEIWHVRNDDIGVYRCVVTSSGGNDTASANITVIEIPYAPSIYNVELNEVDMKAVDVMWSVGFDGNSPILSYTMEYRMVPPGIVLLPQEGWIIVTGDIPHDARMYTVGDLLPSRSYEFRVTATNAVGMGQPSEPSEVIEIPQQPPSGPPRGVYASPRSNSSIRVQWQPPDEEDWNGPLLGYTIKLKPSGYGDETLEYKNITNYLITMHDIQGLIVWTEYEIAVAAFNAKGTGVYSDYVFVRTLEGVPTAAPYGLTAAAQNSTAILATWMPPEPQFINGINLGYKIHARRINVLEPEVEVVVPSNISNMLGRQTGYILDLRKYEEYSITVLCYTSMGNGPKSDATEEQTLQDIPGPVATLSFDNVLDTSLRVLWNAPLNINGILTGYTLTYQKKDEPISKVPQELGPSTLNYTISGLTATTVYVIEVFAHTEVGPGPPRSAEIESGIPPVKPEPPTSLAVSNIRETQVLLQFAPGFSGHTSISLWIVEQQTSVGAPWELVYEEYAPDVTSLTVTNLRPYTQYRLRMLAENIADVSEPSEPTVWFQTIQALPYLSPADISMRAVNETAIRVGWTPLHPNDWNGEPQGYRIEYRMTSASENDTQTIDVLDESTNSHMIARLEEWVEYEVRVAALNALGAGPYSGGVSDRTWEAAPSAGPSNVRALAVSSTSIRVEWDNVSIADQNGPILGFKVQYQSVEENIAPVMKIINSSTARDVVLSDLRKFVYYEIRVLANTRIGDGVLSAPEVRVQTFEDAPGAPCCVFFPEVTHTFAKIIWGPPSEPNGIISGYKVGYRQKHEEEDQEIVDPDLGPERREFTVDDLQRNVYYLFSVTAKTVHEEEEKWGVRNELEVYTIINRREPDPPTQPQIVEPQVGDRQVTINWQPESDGFGPIRNYTAQVQQDGLVWTTVDAYIPHNVTSYTVTGLHPYTRYRFRVSANNDIGQSLFSEPSRQVLTKQAAPESPPLDLRVMPQTQTSVYVTWQIPPVASWNGHLSGYQLNHKESSGQIQTWIEDKIYFPDMENMIVDNLELFKTYDFQIRCFNMYGHSKWSPVAVVYLEIVPMAPPVNVMVSSLSATEIEITWEPPPVDSQNGDIKGYKVYYWETDLDSSDGHMRQVGAAERELVLTDLLMYTEYSVVLLAYNTAGDGPNITEPVTNRTHEGIPGVPGTLKFVVISLSEVNVSWAPPSEPNGVITKYEVSYKEMSDDDESRHVQEILPGDRHYYIARDLRENVMYQFSVRAKTSVDWGQETSRNITIGPQPGSPGQPGKPQLTPGDKSVTLTWAEGSPGASNITGYIIQAKEKDTSEWETMTNTNSPEPTADIPYVELKPTTEYQFRVIAVNSLGISHPSEASDYLKSWDVEGEEEPFHQKWWFLVIIALIGVIVIILVVFLLCILGRRKPDKYKGQQNVRAPPFPPGTQAQSLPRTTIQLSEPGSSPEEDGGFASLDRRSMRQSSRSRRSQRSVRGPMRHTLQRNGAIGGYAKSPPRPSPGSVNYSDEDYKTHGDDDSSTTEKPSEYSDSGGSQATDSEPESEKDLPPPPFPSEYSSNGDVRHSWKKGYASHARDPNEPYTSHNSAYNYTDSEQDSQTYAMSMNGGHVIMNNMARSRAPLPGFSSFV